jgi:hypothetical protein
VSTYGPRRIDCQRASVLLRYRAFALPVALLSVAFASGCVHAVSARPGLGGFSQDTTIRPSGIYACRLASTERVSAAYGTKATETAAENAIEDGSSVCWYSISPTEATLTVKLFPQSSASRFNTEVKQAKQAEAPAATERPTGLGRGAFAVEASAWGLVAFTREQEEVLLSFSPGDGFHMNPSLWASTLSLAHALYRAA